MDIVEELLDTVKDYIDETYREADQIAEYRNYTEALKMIKRQLDSIDELQEQIKDLESENARLEEENEKLEGQMYDWQEDYQRLEREYANLAENS